jgi:long-chain acyl-CoA synthetase
MTGSLNELWCGSEQAFPDRIALIADGRYWTYAELGAEIRAVGDLLARKIGLGRGDPVALLAPNGMGFVAAYFGILRAGGSVLPIDPRSSVEQQQAAVRLSGARVMLVHERFAPGSGEGDLIVSPGGTGLVARAGAAAQPAASGRLHGGPDEVAELMQTSGTSDAPKIALRSHGNVLAAVRNSIRGFGYSADDVIAVAMALSHSSALNSQLVPMLQIGGTALLVDRFDAQAVVLAMRSHRVTCMRLVPSMLRMLMGCDDFSGDGLPDIRLLTNSSAPVQGAQLEALVARFPRAKVMDSYGLTEASTCTALDVTVSGGRPGAVGAAIDGVELRIVDAAGAPVAAGTEGEVCVRGPHVFLGYLGRAEDTAEVLKGGWLWTGDLGQLDEAGSLYLHGRKADVIHCSGFKVHPDTVERCIRDMRDVDSVAVVGMAHKVLGEVVRAFVVPRKSDLTARRVIHHCVRRLASHEVPFRVEIVSRLPTGASGKVRRVDLKNMSA